MADPQDEIKAETSAKSDKQSSATGLIPSPASLEAVNPAHEEPDPEAVKWFRDHSVPIAGVILILLLLCLVGHYSSITIDWTRTKDFTDAFRNVTQGLAFIGGGIWAYFKFVKGRTFQESLTPIVTGKFASMDGAVFLVVSTQIKNVGLSKIEFNRTASALIVFEYIPAVYGEIHTVADKRLTSFDVFGEKDRYIEPNEIIEGQRLISIPGPLRLAYRLELEILSLSGFTWRATTIVDKSTLTDNTVGQLLGL